MSREALPYHRTHSSPGPMPGDVGGSPGSPRLHRGRLAFTGLRPLLTLPEVADLLRVSEKTIRRLVAARGIPCLRLGRQLRFVPGDVHRWLAARKEG
jgi:excisionase family DNA binding protein